LIRNIPGLTVTPEGITYNSMAVSKHIRWSEIKSFVLSDQTNRRLVETILYIQPHKDARRSGVSILVGDLATNADDLAEALTRYSVSIDPELAGKPLVDKRTFPSTEEFH